MTVELVGVLVTKNVFELYKAFDEIQPLIVKTICVVSTPVTVTTRWRTHPNVTVIVFLYQLLDESEKRWVINDSIHDPSIRRDRLWLKDIHSCSWTLSFVRCFINPMITFRDLFARRVNG